MRLSISDLIYSRFSYLPFILLTVNKNIKNKGMVEFVEAPRHLTLRLTERSNEVSSIYNLKDMRENA